MRIKGLMFLSAILPAVFCGAMQTRSLDGSWAFAFLKDGCLEDISTGFQTTDQIVVPGCFDMMPKWYAQRGVGLYRCVFDVERDCAGATLVVKGMGLKGRFWLDGRFLKEIRIPYSTFELELGGLTEGRHVLEAALDNKIALDPHRLDQPFYDFFLSGGFYHGTELRIRHGACELDRVLVRTRDISTGTVELELLAKGEPLPETWMGEVSFDNGRSSQVLFKNGRAVCKVPNFRLWDFESPNLHWVRVSAAGFGETGTRFGIREIKAFEKSFWLNGRRIRFNGVNRHESDAQFGYATSRQIMYRDLQLIKSLGCNFVRGSHYPQAEDFLDLCDELGILVWEESLGWGNEKELADPEFRRLQVEQTQLMVKNSINHPSVVVSGYMNEFHSYLPEGRALSDRLIDVIRSADTGHLVSFACCHVWEDECNDRTDFIAINQYPSWHQSKGTGFTEESLRGQIHQCVTGVVARLRKRYGEDKPIIVGETGVYAIYGNHDPMGAQWTEEFQAEYLNDWLEEVEVCPEMAGLLVWQFSDARTYFRGGSDVRTKPFAYNMAGLFDRERRPKMAAACVRRHFLAKEAK